MKLKIEGQVVTLYGLPTVEMIRTLLNNLLDEEYDKYIFRIELLSPEDKKEVATVPLLEILKRRIAEGEITEDEANNVIGLLRTLPTESIEKLAKSVGTGVLNL